MDSKLRIYIADIPAYNNGKLHGVWITATDCMDDIQEQINEMLAESPEDITGKYPYHDYAIHDYEGFEGFNIEEYNCIETVHDIACFILDNPEIGGELLDYCYGDLDKAKTQIDENYCGRYKSLADYAQELTEETSQIPENLAFYIDYEKMGRDMELNGDVYTIESGYEDVHIFWNH